MSLIKLTPDQQEDIEGRADIIGQPRDVAMALCTLTFNTVLERIGARLCEVEQELVSQIVYDELTLGDGLRGLVWHKNRMGRPGLFRWLRDGLFHAQLEAIVRRIMKRYNRYKLLKSEFHKGYIIIEARLERGWKGWRDWGDPNNILSAGETRAAGWTREDIIRLRQLLESVGGLEQIFYDYWRRRSEAEIDHRAAVPLMDMPDLNDVMMVLDQGWKLSYWKNV